MLRKIFPSFLVLIFLLSACNFPTGVNANSTAVAQTVDAIRGQATSAPGVATVQPPAGSETATPTTELPATATVQPTAAFTATITNTSGPCNLATMLSETVPDDAEINVNQAFVKTWTLKNVGSCTWTSGYKVIFASGDAMSGPASFQLTSGTVAPGESVVVAVNLVAPADTGTYRGNWKLQSSEGQVFTLTSGNPFWVQIKAVSSGGSDFHVVPLPNVPLFPLLSAYTKQTVSQTSIPAGSTGSATSTCPDGTVVVGGGFAGNSNLVVYTSMKQGNGWIAYGYNGSAGPQLINAYAVCLYNASGATVTQVLKQVDVPVGGFGRAEATCPAGSVPTGGGWASNKRLEMYNSNNTNTGWEVYARSKSPNSEVLNGYALCLSGTTATIQEKGTQISIAAGTAGWDRVLCPEGSLVTGGGFALSANMMIYNTSVATEGNGWASYARNSGAGDSLMNIYATCLTFH